MSDHFERLGLPRRFSVDLPLLEQEYLARSRQHHPDFHTYSTPDELRASLEASAKLNEAYLTLKEPFRRANYLLGLYGGPSATEEKSLDQAFLMEMMELQEQLEEAKSRQQPLAPIEAAVQSRLSSVLAELEASFRQLEANAAAPQRSELVTIRRLLNAAKTLQSLQRQLDDDL